MKNQQQPKYQLSRYRFVNLILFILAAIVNSLPSQTFASISTLIEEQFLYSPAIVTFMILLSPIIHPIMAVPSSWILDKFGVKIGCSIGGLFVLLGAWCRMLMEIQNPGWGILASLLIAIGNVFVLNSPSAFALNWFSSETVPLVIAATVLFNLLSNGFGASLGGYFLKKDQTTIQDMKKFFFIEAIIITIPFLLFFIFFKNLPASPPNKSAARQKTSKSNKIPYKQLIKQLLKNTSYLKVIIAMSFSYGTFISLASILDQSLDYLGYQNSGKATSSTLISAMLAGSVSAFFFTKIIKETLKYKFIISMCLLGSFLTFMLLEMTFFFKIQETYMILYMGACAGFFIIPLTALFTTYSAELTYPIPQASVTGYLFAGSQTVGFLFGMFWISIMSQQHIWTVYLMFAAHTLLIIISWIISLNTKQNLARSQFELDNSLEVQEQDEAHIKVSPK